MSYVRSFDDFTPPARFDAVPFTEALIQESASETTGFSTIDTKALNPVDSNPATPQARDFTTDDAALAAGWYRIVWKDAAGSTFESDAVYFPPATSAPATVTLDDLKRYLDITKPDKDELLAGVLSATKGFVAAEYVLQLEPFPAAAADPVVVSRRVRGGRFIRVPDAREITAVAIDGIEVTDYELLPRGGRPEGPFPCIEVLVHGQVAEVTGRFGFRPLPWDLRDFILSLAARRYKEGPAVGFADARSDEFGDRVYFQRLPESMKAVGESYRVHIGEYRLA